MVYRPLTSLPPIFSSLVQVQVSPSTVPLAAIASPKLLERVVGVNLVLRVVSPDRQSLVITHGTGAFRMRDQEKTTFHPFIVIRAAKFAARSIRTWFQLPIAGPGSCEIIQLLVFRPWFWHLRLGQSHSRE